MVSKVDFLPAGIDTLRLLKAEAEAQLSAQLQSGIAADQRAISFLSLLAAAAVVVAGGGASLILADKPNPTLGWTCIVIAVGLLAAMGCAASSAMAVDFHYQGSWPRYWIEDIKRGLTPEESLAEQIAHLDEALENNNRVLARNAKWMNAGVWIAWGTLVLGSVAGAVILWNR